jgi:hypothetical protein
LKVFCFKLISTEPVTAEINTKVCRGSSVLWCIVLKDITIASIDFVSESGTGPASGDGAQPSFMADSKRSPPDQMIGHIPLPFDERRSMQPIGTERSSKKARTQQPTPDPTVFNDNVLQQQQQQQQQQMQQQQHMWTIGQCKSEVVCRI